MVKHEADIKEDIKPVKDGGEAISLMEPLLIGDGSSHRADLTDLALELAQKSAGFRRSLPDSLLASLADLVRAMNCYYSNLIEGHDTHPVDIERALKNDYSSDAKSAISNRKQKRISPSSSGSMPAVSKAAPSTPIPFVKSIVASANCCPTTCCG